MRNHAEKRSLHEAERAFLLADYSAAVLLLNRFVRNHPESFRSLEARWWLARAYQETGNLSAAAEHFRVLADAPASNFYQAEARLRAAHIDNLLGAPPSNEPVRGMLVSLASLRTPGGLAPVSAASQAIDGSVILLDVPCGVDGNVRRHEPLASPNMLQAVVQRLRAQGMAVYLGVTLRCLGNVAPNQRGALAPWKDWDYHPQSGTVRRSPYYSLSHVGYRDFLVDWISHLRDLPLTGLVFRDEVFPGPYEGFSPLAVKVFEQAFNVDFDPVRVLNDHGPILATDAGSDVALPAVFWKWAGWKARERLRILRTLVEAVRVHLPHLRFGLEVQLQSVADPVHGLVHFAEDWVEAAHGPFDVLLTRIQATGPAWLHAAPHGLPAGRSDAWAEVVRQMVRSVGTPEKIWTILPGQSLRLSGAWRMLPEGVGRIYDHRVVP